METQRILVKAAAVCLLLGASSAAMAVNCPVGIIVGKTVDEITVDGTNCFISDVVVLGGITVSNGGELVVRETRVFGDVRIENTSDIGFFDNEIVDGNVIVDGARVVYVAGNILIRSGRPRRLVVRNNLSDGEGVIWNNIVEEGRIRCRNNNGVVGALNNIASSVQCPLSF